MITLTLTAPSHQELRAQMREFLGMDKEAGPQPGAPVIGFDPAVPGADKTAFHKLAEVQPHEAATINTPMIATPPADVFASPGLEPAKRKRRTKAELEAAKSNGTHAAAPAPVSRAEEAPAAQQTTSVAAPIVSKEAAHQALQQVNVAVGLPKAREILTSFGAQRISDVKETDFAALIEKCNAAVMMA